MGTKAVLTGMLVMLGGSAQGRVVLRNADWERTFLDIRVPFRSGEGAAQRDGCRSSCEIEHDA
jgi:hypothetical protein